MFAAHLAGCKFDIFVARVAISVQMRLLSRVMKTLCGFNTKVSKMTSTRTQNDPPTCKNRYKNLIFGWPFKTLKGRLKGRAKTYFNGSHLGAIWTPSGSNSWPLPGIVQLCMPRGIRFGVSIRVTIYMYIYLYAKLLNVSWLPPLAHPPTTPPPRHRRNRPKPC